MSSIVENLGRLTGREENKNKRMKIIKYNWELKCEVKKKQTQKPRYIIKKSYMEACMDRNKNNENRKALGWGEGATVY